MRTRAAIYTRISLDRSGESESPERQEAACRSLAAQRGWEVTGVYADRDTSAYKRGVRRAGYDRLLADLRGQQVDVVLVWKLDRLTRGGLAGITPVLELLREVGAQLVSVTETIDTTTPMGEAMVGVLASMAKQESENTSLRVRTANASRARNGKLHGGGSRPYGLTRDGQVVPEEAAIVREVAARVLDGESLRKIAADLNARGVPTTTAGTRRRPRPQQVIDPALLDEDGRYELPGEWRSVTLGKLLRSPTLAGLRVHDGVELPGEWEPILTPDEHRRLLDALARPVTQRRDEGRSHLLSGAGVIRCGLCESPLRRMSFRMRNGRMFDRYQCLDQPGQRQCGRLAITQGSVDAHVTAELLDFLARAKLRPLDDDGDEDEVQAQLDDAKSALGDLVHERFVRRTIDQNAFDTARKELDAEVSALESRLLALRQRHAERMLSLPLGDRQALDAWWHDATPEDRIVAVRQSIAKVKILPARRRGGNRFDSGRVRIGWRWDLFIRAAERFEQTATDEERRSAEAAYLDRSFVETQRSVDASQSQE